MQAFYKKKLKLHSTHLWPTLLLAVVGLIFVYLTSRFSVFSHDDPTNLIIFKNLLIDHSYFQSLWKLFIHFDFNHFEYRTFWFSRLLHFHFFIFIGLQRPWIYQILMSLTHVAIAWLVWVVISLLSPSPDRREFAFLAGMLWLMTPFSASIFVFHHFGYQVLPVFFGLVYCYWLLQQMEKEQFDHSFIFVGAIVFQMMVFSGEHTLPVVGLVVVWMSLWLWMKKRSFTQIVVILSHFIASCIAIIGHMLVVQSQVNIDAQTQRRFSFFDPNHLSTFAHTIVLWLKDQVWPTYLQTVSVFSTDYGQIIPYKTTCFLWIGILILMVIVWRMTVLPARTVSKSRVSNVVDPTLILVLFSLFVGSFVLYMYLIGINGGGGYFPRYSYLSGTVGLLLLVAVGYMIFNRYVARLFAWLVLGYCVLLFSIVQLQQKPYLFQIGTHINQVLNTGLQNGKKAVLIAHARRFRQPDNSPFWWQVPFTNENGVQTSLINMYAGRYQHPYKYFYSLDRTLTDFLGYELVSYSDFMEVGTQSSTIQLKSYYGQSKEYKPEDILVIGNTSIDPDFTIASQSEVVPFDSWSDFKVSAAYRGIVVFSTDQTKGLAHHYLISPPETIIDLPSEAIDQGQKPELIDTLTYWQTNQAGSFSFQLPASSDQGQWMVFDFYDMWQTQPGQRLFSIMISIDDQQILLSPIDLVKLGGNQQLISIAVWTQPGSERTISTSALEGSSDVPFISGIRLYNVQEIIHK